MINYLNNYEKIDDLVKKHFSLEKSSQKTFSENIFKGTTADDFIQSKLDSNFRIEKNLSLSNLEKIDTSWSYFKMYFGEYCIHRNLKYHEYYYNTLHRTRMLKVSKDVLDFYLNTKNAFIEVFGESDLRYNLNKIQEMKLPKKKLKIVLSFNLSDMFMCSSGQDWSSCLNLESQYFGCYWLGLASLPFDKNRCMIYIAPQKEDNRNVFGIETERMYRRTFALLDHQDRINVLKWYPNHFNLNTYLEEINEMFDEFRFKQIEQGFVPKYETTLPKLKVENKNIEFYIYQDNTFLNDSKVLYFTFDKGNQSFHNGFSRFGPFISCEGGLSYLKESREQVSNYVNKQTYYCDRCDCEVSEESSVLFSSSRYCRDCYNEIAEEIYA